MVLGWGAVCDEPVKGQCSDRGHEWAGNRGQGSKYLSLLRWLGERSLILSGYFKRCFWRSKVGTWGRYPKLRSLFKCIDFGCEQNCRKVKCLSSNSRELFSHHWDVHTEIFKSKCHNGFNLFSKILPENIYLYKHRKIKEIWQNYNNWSF